MMRQQVLASSRMALRASAANASARRAAPAVARRYASSTTTKAAVESVKSDAPWAITSLVVFGGMFVYITSPPGKGGAHGHHGSDEHGEQAGRSEKVFKSQVHEPDYDGEYKVHRDPDEDAPSGDKKLAERSQGSEDDAFKQRANKDSPQIQRRDDSTFQHGLAAAKEGHKDSSKTVSDPKKVVAAAKAERQDKDAKAKGLQPEEDGDDEE